MPRVFSFGLAVATFLGASRLSAWAAPPPKLSKGPYLTDLSDTHVEVRFELSAAAPARVTFELPGDASPARTLDEPSTAMHVVRASGLKAATTYGYTVRVGGALAGGGHFTTAPEPTLPPASAAPTTFLVFGDDRSDPTAHAAVVRAMAATPADFLVNTGDVVADGGRDADWQSFFDVEATLLKDHALFLCVGNHELVDDEAGANFARYFGLRDEHGAVTPYGTTRWSSVRFFFLNGMHDWRRGEEREWLERELAHADDEPGLVWRVAVVHHGPWSSGPHAGNAKLLSAGVPEMLAAHHVDLVLSGHDHLYERGHVGTVKYLVSGGGGAPLYPVQNRLASSAKAESVYHFVEVTVSPDAVRTVARGVDGTVIDDCGFHKATGWECDPPAALPAPRAPSPQPGSSRCGCRVPGCAPGGEKVTSMLLLAVGALGALRLRASLRRRG